MPENVSDGKLGEAPPPGSPVEEIAAFLTLGYGLPDGYYVSRVIRHGGRAGTGLTVLIRPPGDGVPLRIHYERETDCLQWQTLAGRAAADTRGLTRGRLITSQKAALAMYEALCSVADHFEAVDQNGQTWEWVQHLRRFAAMVPGAPNDYWALRRLQDHDYSKSLVLNPPRDDAGKPQRPVPLLLHTEGAGERYITARQMAVFLRYDLGVEDAGSDDQILTRLERIGGERIEAQEWDRPGRDREHKVTLVLYRLPDPDGGTSERVPACPSASAVSQRVPVLNAYARVRNSAPWVAVGHMDTSTRTTKRRPRRGQRGARTYDGCVGLERAGPGREG